MYKINYSIIKFEVKFLNDSKLNVNKQSALRGILGNILINDNCIVEKEKRDCKSCVVNSRCVAQNIFSPKIKNGTIDDGISPFVIICDDKREVIEKDNILTFAMVFFSNTIAYIPTVIRAIEKAGNTLGLEKNKFKLISVLNDRNKIIYSENEECFEKISIRSIQEYIENRLSISKNINIIRIINPVRFKKNKRINNDLNEDDLINLIKRRLSTLALLEDRELEINGDLSIEVKNKDIKWEEFNRYSNRQNTKMSLGGVVGTVELGKISEDAKKLLIAGELTHIGKNTSFGLGDYILY